MSEILSWCIGVKSCFGMWMDTEQTMNLHCNPLGPFRGDSRWTPWRGSALDRSEEIRVGLLGGDPRWTHSEEICVGPFGGDPWWTHSEEIRIGPPRKRSTLDPLGGDPHWTHSEETRGGTPLQEIHVGPLGGDLRWTHSEEVRVGTPLQEIRVGPLGKTRVGLKSVITHQ